MVKLTYIFLFSADYDPLILNIVNYEQPRPKIMENT